jgi:hypothetical protein
MICTLAPFFFIDPRSISTTSLLLGVVAYGAVILVLVFKILKPRTTARTVGRYVANYVAIVWAMISVGALFGIAISFLA